MSNFSKWKKKIPLRLISYQRAQVGNFTTQKERPKQLWGNQGPTLMIWGALSINGLVPLSRLEKNIDIGRFLDAFGHKLKWTNLGLYGGRLVVQQDNASIHQSREVLRWFNLKDIRLLDWPAQSASLNIIA